MTGRPSKGDRDAIMTRPPKQIGEAARKAAAKRGMTVSDFVAAAVAKELGLADTFPMSNESELPLSA